MKTWTTQAEERLRDYLLERTRREGLHGHDAEELKQDLLRHIYEEAENSRSRTIGLMTLESILGKLDAGYQPRPEPPPAAEPPTIGRRSTWIFGVVLPIVILLMEATTSICGAAFFDPIPTWWHLTLVALVPLLNLWLLNGSPGAGGDDRWTGVAAGASLAISAFYGILFLPLLPLSICALLFVGAGIISLSPILAWLVSWRLGRALRANSRAPRRYRGGWWMGAATVALALLALEGPAVWTRVNLASAASEEGDERAIARLRAFHSERSLLKACYEGNRGSAMGTDIAGWGASGWQMAPLINAGGSASADSARMRDVFFRVTGKPFNSLKPPVSDGGRLIGREDPLGEVEFDDHVGGDQVAVRLRNLDLKESRFDGHADSISRIGYGEWTMVFHNSSRSPQEARCQVRLPEGGRVSRLTLWVNGEPREAAFNTVTKVKAAYKAVAVVQRRDPVLVTMAGPDTVLVQCFPVPARGEMKIRFGITAPFAGSTWKFPRLVEQNFGTTKGLEHAVWFQGDRDFQISANGRHPAGKDGEGRSLLLALPIASVMGRGPELEMPGLPAEPGSVWTEDRFAPPQERILIREPKRVTIEGTGKVVMVIDGSASLAPRKETLSKALGANVIALLADDTARRIDAGGLGKYTFSGGRNNEPALIEGIRLSRELGGIPVVWIHGPQATTVAQTERLAQMLERGTIRTVIHTIEGAPGPNRLAEAIYRSSLQKRGPDLADAGALTHYLHELIHGGETTGWTWRREVAKEGQPGTRVWDQLARLWAIGAAEDPRQMVAENERPALAARYQLVTTVSGAVVLETDAQYKQHGLTPADADATPEIPSVPEPSTSMLVLVAATAALMRRQRGPG